MEDRREIITKIAFNGMSGMSTTSPAEGLNSLFEKVMEHKQRPVDVLNIAMLQLSIHYCNEIKLGFTNIGNYKLKQEFSSPRIDRIEKKLTKAPIIGDMIHTKNNGTTGSKFKGHLKNSIPLNRIYNAATSATVIHENVENTRLIRDLKYLKELISDGDTVVNYVDENKLFEESAVEVDGCILSDIFLTETFELDSLRNYFDEDGWKSCLMVQSKS